MRRSLPMPLRTLFTSAPTRSQMFEISLMNEIFVASIEFAAYFVSSALLMSMAMNASSERMNGR